MSRQTAAAKEIEHPAGLLISAQLFCNSTITDFACRPVQTAPRVSPMLLAQFRPHGMRNAVGSVQVPTHARCGFNPGELIGVWVYRPGGLRQVLVRVCVRPSMRH